jgi:hypothetical protein
LYWTRTIVRYTQEFKNCTLLSLNKFAVISIVLSTCFRRPRPFLVILGTLESFEKGPLASSCLSVCPSLRFAIWSNPVPTRQIFVKLCRGIGIKIWREFSNLFKMALRMKIWILFGVEKVDRRVHLPEWIAFGKKIWSSQTHNSGNALGCVPAVHFDRPNIWILPLIKRLESTEGSNERHLLKQ